MKGVGTDGSVLFLNFLFSSYILEVSEVLVARVVRGGEGSRPGQPGDLGLCPVSEHNVNPHCPCPWLSCHAPGEGQGGSGSLGVMSLSGQRWDIYKLSLEFSI